MVRVPKKTDLSIEFDRLSDDQITDLFNSTSDDPRLKTVLHNVLEDRKCLYDPYGHRKITLRDMALHAYNRNQYLLLRVKSQAFHVHQALDQLLYLTMPMEGEQHASLMFREQHRVRFEIIGCYDFEVGLGVLPHLEPVLRVAGYKTVSSY